MMKKNYMAVVFCAAVLMVSVLVKLCPGASLEEGGSGIETDVRQILDTMSTEQKIAQMIMPAIRTWEDEDVTDLSAVPALSEALRRHQYGGIILFGSNVKNSDQTVRLICDLQSNNAKSGDAAAAGIIPYLVAADQEGGSVARLTMGTRGTGSMAIGATAEKAEENAKATGRIFGEELEALGINVNLGPCIDVIHDLADPGMSTRVYSDDPDLAAKLGLAFAEGIGQSEVITTYKHFPGAGDGSDYPTSICLTLDELKEKRAFGLCRSYRRRCRNDNDISCHLPRL